MASRCPLAPARWVAASLTLALLGCAASPKMPFASKGSKNPENKASTESGSGSFAPNTGVKDPVKVHLAYGQWQEQMGQEAEARQSYAKALAQEPKNVDALLGMARLDQAAGLMNEAEARLKKASKISPKEPKVLTTYGNFYAAQKDWPKAIDKLQSAAKLCPDDPNCQYLLAVAMARSGDLEAAFPCFARSVGEAAAHYNIGYICYENGKTSESLHHLHEALALNPELTAAQNMLDRLEQRPGMTLPASATRTQAPVVTPGSSVRKFPLRSQQEIVPLSGNETSLPSSGNKWATGTLTAPNSGVGPQMPGGLTPQQQEQWRNQQGR